MSCGIPKVLYVLIPEHRDSTNFSSWVIRSCMVKMESGFKKSNVLSLKRVRVLVGIKLPNTKVMNQTVKEGYKYLGVLCRYGC